MPALEVITMALRAKLPLRNVDFNKLIQKSKFYWQVVNENVTPICITRLDPQKRDLFPNGGNIRVTIWKSGAVNIAGVKSKQEGRKVHTLILEDLEELWKELKK